MHSTIEQKDEVEEYKKKDPINQVKEVLLSKKYATEDQIKEIDQKVKNLVLECQKFVEESEFPPVEQLYDSVYEQENYPFIPHKL